MTTKPIAASNGFLNGPSSPINLRATPRRFFARCTSVSAIISMPPGRLMFPRAPTPECRRKEFDSGSCDLPASIFELGADDVVVELAAGQQLFVGAARDDAALVEH